MLSLQCQKNISALNGEKKLIDTISISIVKNKKCSKNEQRNVRKISY